jgi:hypothetical protein
MGCILTPFTEFSMKYSSVKGRADCEQCMLKYTPTQGPQSSAELFERHAAKQTTFVLKEITHASSSWQ